MKEKFEKIRELAEELGKSKAVGGGYIILAAKENEDGESHATISILNGPRIDLVSVLAAAMKENKTIKDLIMQAMMFSAIIPDKK